MTNRNNQGNDNKEQVEIARNGTLRETKMFTSLFNGLQFNHQNVDQSLSRLNLDFEGNLEFLRQTNSYGKIAE